jgi:hypothetical protein
MPKRGVSLCLLLLCFILSMLTTGCATTSDRKVNLTYEPMLHASGGSGDLYLAKVAEPATTSENQAVQWVLGTIKDSDGKKLGNVVTDTLPADQLLQAFSKELKAAGYTVIPVKDIPVTAVKGISLSSMVITLDEVSSLAKVDAKSSVRVSADVWRNGSKVTKLSYETVNSDMTITGRDQFLEKILQKSLQNLMEQAVPALIKTLEQ